MGAVADGKTSAPKRFYKPAPRSALGLARGQSEVRGSPVVTAGGLSLCGAAWGLWGTGAPTARALLR